MLDWLLAIAIGILAGLIAERLMNRGGGIIISLIVGVVGGIIGRFLLNLAGFPLAANLAHMGLPYSGLLATLITSVLGAVVLLFILGLFSRRR